MDVNEIIKESVKLLEDVKPEERGLIMTAVLEKNKIILELVRLTSRNTRKETEQIFKNVSDILYSKEENKKFDNLCEKGE